MVSRLANVINTDKSDIIHFGFNNNEASYVLGTSTLCTVDEERDLGLITETDKTAKPGKQCATTARAANAVLGTIKTTFLCKVKN